MAGVGREQAAALGNAFISAAYFRGYPKALSELCGSAVLQRATLVLGKIGETRYSKVGEGSPGKVFCNKNLQMIFDVSPDECHLLHHTFQEKPSPALSRMNALSECIR